MVYVFCFQVLLWLPFAPMLAEQLGFTPIQALWPYPWQVYIPPGAGKSRNVPMVLTQLSFSHSNQYDRVYCFGDLAKSPDLSTFPTGWGGVLTCSFFPSNDTTYSAFMVVVNRIILVWWLHMSLMDLLVPGQHSILLLYHTFNLDSQGRYQY